MVTNKRKPAAPQPVPLSSAPLDWPPYGLMNAGFMHDVLTRRVPLNFRLGGVPADEKSFAAWVDALVGKMAKFLWPRYVHKAAQPWQGAAALTARDLTIADFKLLGDLRAKLAETPIGRDKGLTQTHKALFLSEDMKPWPTYALYETALAPELLTKMQEAMVKTNVNFGPAPLRFKALQQRPRPYQMALLLDIADFAYEWAHSAVTPSIVSGHSLQGLLAGAGAYTTHLLELEKVVAAKKHLQQWAVDVGDRRVFAGVHYPSDNLASWYVALSMCDNYVYGELGQEAKRFLWQAISERSLVFQAMVQHGGVYAAPLAELRKLAPG